MLDFYSNSEKMIALFFYLFTTSTFIFLIRKLIKIKVDSILQRLFFFFLIIGTIINTIWINSVFFTTSSVTYLISYFSGPLILILWFMASISFITFGVMSILKRESYLKFNTYFCAKINGIGAIFFGVMIVIAGLLMVLMEIEVIGLELCQSKQYACQLLSFVDYFFAGFGSLSIYLMKPLEFLGIVRTL